MTSSKSDTAGDNPDPETADYARLGGTEFHPTRSYD